MIIGLNALVGVAGKPEGVSPSANEVRQLLEANGMWDVAAQVGPVTVQQLSLALRRTNPSLPARADSVVADVVVSYLREHAERDHVADKLIPIYAKHLTKDDVRRITEFYRSPAGRKLAGVTPAISLESAKVGQEWMTSILPGLQSELLTRLRSEKLID
jgi:hypothetical protein